VNPDAVPDSELLAPEIRFDRPNSELPAPNVRYGHGRNK
jgi:hypothetical protein